MELAVAVLDEAVFDLIRQRNAYFDPYRGFYDLKGLDVANYSLIKNLVGRQKFEKKGGNPGGDGGADLGLRSLFKFVSYWNPAIRPDRDGRATISFQAPDNLTGWRVFAMAATPSDRMGLGEQSFKVNKPTELRPVMPNQVIEGDSFAGGFSVMNRTEKPRRLSLKIAASGPIEPSNAEITREIDLQPFKRRTVWLPLTTRSFGEIAFKAAAGDARDKDAMLYKVPVRKYRSLEFAASYGTTQGDSVRESIAIPSAADFFTSFE